MSVWIGFGYGNELELRIDKRATTNSTSLPDVVYANMDMSSAQYPHKTYRCFFLRLANDHSLVKGRKIICMIYDGPSARFTCQKFFLLLLLLLLFPFPRAEKLSV